jgi:nucleotide-binding universal stress UspA family protein
MVGKENSENCDALREAYARLKQAGIKSKKALLDSRDVTAALTYYQNENNIGLLMTGAFGHSRLRELVKGSDTKKLLGSTKTPYLLFPKA